MPNWNRDQYNIPCPICEVDMPFAQISDHLHECKELTSANLIKSIPTGDSTTLSIIALLDGSVFATLNDGFGDLIEVVDCRQGDTSPVERIINGRISQHESEIALLKFALNSVRDGSTYGAEIRAEEVYDDNN